MSFILDALRRADAERERERGAVPGLHTEQATVGPADWAPTPSRRPWLAVAVAAGVVLAGAAVAWMAFVREPATVALPITSGSDGDRATATVTATGRVATPPPTPASTVQAVVTPSIEPELKPGPTAAPPPTVTPRPESVAAVASAPAASAAMPKARRASAPAVAAAKSAPTDAPAHAAAGLPTAKASAARGSAAAAPGASAAPPPRAPTLAELPADIRQQLPTLTVGGAMHSPNAGSRMLILNGQLYHEGEQPAPGVTLESIQLRSAVLSYKGYRYEISY